MSNVKEVFSKRLKEIRKSRGFTQEQLAEKVGVATRHISFIETAKSFPSSDLIDKICNILAVDYSTLFSGNNLTRKDIIKNLNNIIENLDDNKLHILFNIASDM